jgi:hypothetical protein
MTHQTSRLNGYVPERIEKRGRSENILSHVTAVLGLVVQLIAQSLARIYANSKRADSKIEEVPKHASGDGSVIAINSHSGNCAGQSADDNINLPLFEYVSISAAGSISVLDGGEGSTDKTLFTGPMPRQTIANAERGYFFTEIAFYPYIKDESQLINSLQSNQVGASATTPGLQGVLRYKNRLRGSVNYFLNGHNTIMKVLNDFIKRNRLA